MGRKECSVRFGVWRKQWEVRSVKCGLWSVKCGVWSVKCGVWSLKFGVRRVQCEVWSVECEDFASSLAEKKTACRGKDTVGTGCLWTIGHLCLGNFRRRLARVYVNSSFMQFWGISHHIPCLDTHFEASRIVLYTCKNEDVSNRNESFEERTSGWWCNNHLEKWWSSSVGMMTFHSQLFLESHSKFHGSSHHQPDIGLCPTGQWRLDGDFRFTRDSVALTGTWCLLKRLGHVHIKIRHMGHGYISLHINTHIQILLDRGFTHSFHAESWAEHVFFSSIFSGDIPHPHSNKNK